MNNKISISQIKLLTAIGLISIVIPALLWGLWSYCFVSQNNQADRVKMYNSYFPELLNGRYTISLISLLLCLLGITLSVVYWQRRTNLVKRVSIIILIAGIIMIILSLFSLM